MKSKILKIGLALLVVALMITSNVFIATNPNLSAKFQKIFTIGMSGVAYAETPDYTCDGAEDNIQVQEALDALPATGGKLVLFSGDYDFHATVLRAIDNVCIEGGGYATYVNAGATAVFSDGGQVNWVFKNFRTGTGGITHTGTGSMILGCWINTTYQDDMVYGSRGATIYVYASDALNKPSMSVAGLYYVCDGTADDVEIQAALDALPYTGDVFGGTVQLSDGTFNTTATISLKRRGNRLVGQGPEATTIISVGAFPSITLGDATTALNGTSLTLAHLKIGAPTGQAAIYGSLIKFITIDDVMILRGTTGIELHAFWEVLITNTNMRSIKDCGIDIISDSVAGFDDSGQLALRDVRVEMHGTSMSNDARGIRLQVVGANPMHQMLFSRVETDSNDADATGYIGLDLPTAAQTVVNMELDACIFQTHPTSPTDGIGIRSMGANIMVFNCLDIVGGGTMAIGFCCPNNNGSYTFIRPNIQTMLPTTGVGYDPGTTTTAIVLQGGFNNAAIPVDTSGPGNVVQLLNEGDVDDTPVDGATTAPISSNWAFDYGTAMGTSLNANDFSLSGSTLRLDRDRNIILTAGGGWATTTAGCAYSTLVESTTNKQNIWYADFDKDTDENMEWSIVLPNDFATDGTATITAQFVWTAASGSGNVTWACKWISYGDNEVIDAAYGTAQSVTDTLQTANYKHVSSATAAITGAGTPAAGEFAQIRVYRDVSEDGLTADARLMSVILTYHGK